MKIYKKKRIQTRVSALTKDILKAYCEKYAWEESQVIKTALVKYLFVRTNKEDVELKERAKDLYLLNVFELHQERMKAKYYLAHLRNNTLGKLTDVVKANGTIKSKIDAIDEKIRLVEKVGDIDLLQKLEDWKTTLINQDPMVVITPKEQLDQVAKRNEWRNRFGDKD